MKGSKLKSSRQKQNTIYKYYKVARNNVFFTTISDIIF